MTPSPVAKLPASAHTPARKPARTQTLRAFNRDEMSAVLSKL